MPSHGDHCYTAESLIVCIKIIRWNIANTAKIPRPVCINKKLHIPLFSHPLLSGVTAEKCVACMTLPGYHLLIEKCDKFLNFFPQVVGPLSCSLREYLINAVGILRLAIFHQLFHRLLTELPVIPSIHKQLSLLGAGGDTRGKQAHKYGDNRYNCFHALHPSESKTNVIV